MSVHAIWQFFEGWLTPRKRDWVSYSDRQNRAGDFGGKSGFVSLVGAGPGDPDLLTVKALRLLNEADVVLHDWLISDEVLRLIPRHTRREFVGKKCGKHSIPQSAIGCRMVELAQQGLKVVRLKGGDPAIFARTLEESDALEEAGIPYEVVPGITAASAASAYCGLPLTSRGVANSVLLSTPSLADPTHEPDWQQYQYHTGSGGQTLVFYMARNKLHLVADKLQLMGWPADTPLVLVSSVSTPQQRQVKLTLANHDQVDLSELGDAPTLILVGQSLSRSMHSQTCANAQQRIQL